MEYWSPKIAIWQKIYCIIHFVLVLVFYHLLVQNHKILNQITVLCCIGVLIVSMTTIGLLLENHRFGSHLELIRCLIFLYFHKEFLTIFSMDMTLSLSLIQIKNNIFVYSFFISAIIHFFNVLFRNTLYMKIIYKRFDKIQCFHIKNKI